MRLWKIVKLETLISVSLRFSLFLKVRVTYWSKGKDDKAETVLARLFGCGAVSVKVKKIKASLVAGHQPQFSDLMNKVTGKVCQIVWVSIGLVGTYGFYALCAAISIIFVHITASETRGKKLEEMEG